MKKLNESLQTTLQKLEESKQLLKTNENGSLLHRALLIFNCFKLVMPSLVINWLNKQVTENQLGRSVGQPAVGAFEMNSTSSATARALVGNLFGTGRFVEMFVVSSM